MASKEKRIALLERALIICHADLGARMPCAPTFDAYIKMAKIELRQEQGKQNG